MSNRSFAGASLCLFGVAGGPAAASAHAFLQTSVPAVGSTVRTSPTEVAIDFTEGVEPAFSSIVVTDSRGVRVDRGEPHLEAGDAHLATGLRPLSPGRYLVTWHAVAVDTHRTEGSFGFTVAP